MKHDNEYENNKKQDEYQEQDIIDQISKISENVNVPDNLKPKNIERLLEVTKELSVWKRPISDT